MPQWVRWAAFVSNPLIRFRPKPNERNKHEQKQTNFLGYTANVLSAESTDECLQTKS